MNAEGHLQRALEIEASVVVLVGEPHPEDHVATIVEGTFGAAQHFIACGMERRHGEHLNSHVGMIRMLREQGHPDIAALFRQLDQLRMGRWYGRRGNGEVIEQCQRILQQIHQWAIE